MTVPSRGNGSPTSGRGTGTSSHTAWDDKVAVLAREDLLELLDMACTGGFVREAVERIRFQAYTRPFGEEDG